MTEGITEAQRVALAILGPWLDEGTYLAGGVAIAVELKHRLSLDLDLFVDHDFVAERLEGRLMTEVPALRILGRASGTLHGDLGGVPISILSYRYPLLAPLERRASLGIPSASLDDLACMKVSAIAGRGAAKDFWDLHELIDHGVGAGDLWSILQLYQRKFPTEDVGHVIRSLAYFGDADAAPLPRGLNEQRWAVIKRAAARRVKAL